MWGPHDVSVMAYGYEIPLAQNVLVPQHEIVNAEFSLDQGSNVAPQIDAGPDAIVIRGSAFISTGFFSDSGDGPWTATVDYGDGSGPSPLGLTGKEFSSQPYLRKEWHLHYHC